tara:strand:+ start:77 stop:355 length:279 start_codon:yes stop_codon:yes gene_type:complete
MLKAEAIIKLNPNVVTVRGGDKAYDKDDNEVTYDNAAVEAEVLGNAYKEQRAAEYKPLAEQLDMQYHDSQNGTETWLDHIKEVKAKYPKGDE